MESLAEAMRRNLRTRLVLSTGNIGFALTRFLMLAGQFNYGKRGILDLTHTRLFTFATLGRLLDGAGFRIESVSGVPAPFRLAFGDKAAGRFFAGANRAFIRVRRQLFSYQVFAVAHPRPSLSYLLDRAHEESRSRADASEELARAPAGRDDGVTTRAEATPKR